MPADMSQRFEISPHQAIDVISTDRFRASLSCDLFIPSYVHSLSIATEFIYQYVFSKFPKDYFTTIHVVGKNPFEDFRRMEVGEYAKRENPLASLSYTIQYDFDDNGLDQNLLSTDRYLRKDMWDRSFFKCPKYGLYVGMDFEKMLIEYTFRFKVNTKAEQVDLYNRLRKVFRIGCTETDDIDADFHIDYKLMTKIAKVAGFQVDSNGEIEDPWNFVKFVNFHSQMPIMYKLRLINQKYEFFLRMRNLPVHLDFKTPLDVDEGSANGMMTGDYTIEMRIPVLFPAPRTFALYNEAHWKSQIHTEELTGISVYSMKVNDIPETNYKGWPMYGHSNYSADEDEKVVKEIDIRPLFQSPVDMKIGSSLDDLIQESLELYRDPSAFIEIGVYSDQLFTVGPGRLPITMDWENRKIILPEGTTERYFYLAVYVDRGYVNEKVIQKTGADKNRVAASPNNDQKIEHGVRQLDQFEERHYQEEKKFNGTYKPADPKKRSKFVI